MISIYLTLVLNAHEPVFSQLQISRSGPSNSDSDEAVLGFLCGALRGHNLLFRRFGDQALLQALDYTCLVSEFSPSGMITYINNKNTEVLGGKKEDIEGTMLPEIDYMAKNKPKEFKKFWDNLLNGIRQTREFNLTIEGKEVWVSEFFTPITDEHGQVTKIFNIGFDISDRKQKENEMSKLIAELESSRKKKN